MGWLRNVIVSLKEEQSTSWAFVKDIEISDSDTTQQEIKNDECYVELYIESLRLGTTRKFATEFDGIVYAFAETSREGEAPGKLTAVTRPDEISGVGQARLGDVITFERRMFKVIPWRGAPLKLELGLFSVKVGNVVAKMADFLVKLSDQITPGVSTTVNPLLPFVNQGLDIIAGQTEDVELELAIDASLSPVSGSYYAIIRKLSSEVQAGTLTVGSDRRLFLNGEEIKESYCLFSIRARKDNPDWGAIAPLRESFAALKDAIVAGQEKPAAEALSAFRRQVIVSPDLIDLDKKNLIGKAEKQMAMAFSGGMISRSIDQRKESLKELDFDSLNLYDL